MNGNERKKKSLNIMMRGTQKTKIVAFFIISLKKKKKKRDIERERRGINHHQKAETYCLELFQ